MKYKIENKEEFLKKGWVVCLIALVCCMLWGSAFPCVKIGYELFNIQPNDTASQILFAGVRFTIAGLLATIIGSFLSKKILIPKKKSWGMIILLCLVQTVSQYLFFYIGLANTSGVKASIIEASNVFLAILFSAFIFRYERLGLTKILGCIIGFLGVVLINITGSGLDSNMTLLGEGFILFSAISYALSSVLIKSFSKKENPVVLSGYQFFVGGLIMIIVGASMGGKLVGFTVQSTFLLIYLALISAVAYSLWGILLKHNPVSKVTVYGFMNPVFGVILSAILLNEQNQAFTIYGLLSLILVSIGIFIVNFDFKKIKNNKKHINKENNMSFLELVKNRYSCRKMNNKKVSSNDIDKILDAAIVAPTAVNYQPFKLWVLDSNDSKEKIKSVTNYTFDADTFIVVGSNKNEAWVRKYDQKNYADIDASIVATHIMLEIEDLGLNTTWVGSFDAPKLKELCPQMKDYELIALFPIGYKSNEDAGKPSTRHLVRKEKQTLVERL